MNESPNLILVTPHGRSGSLFFQSLFDGHPQVIAFPSLELSYSFPISILNPVAAVDEFILKHPSVFDSSKGYLGLPGANVTSLFGPDKSNHLYVDAMEFRENAIHDEFDSWINDERPISRKDFVIGVHKAFARTIGQDPSKIKYILFHAHDYDGSHNQALVDFPNLFYVAMVRDPREDWLSWDKVCALRGGDGYATATAKIYHRNNCIKSYANFMQNLYQFSLNLHPSHLRIIDLNRFHELNRDAMISLANYFHIEWHDILLESTFLGKVWWGNSADRSPISGFDPKKIPYNWPTKLPTDDEAEVSSALREPIRMLNFPTGTLITIFERFKNDLFRSLNSIAKRKSFNHKILRRIPLFLAKALFMVSAVLSATVLLVKSLYINNMKPTNTSLKGREFDLAVFL